MGTGREILSLQMKKKRSVTTTKKKKNSYLKLPRVPQKATVLAQILLHLVAQDPVQDHDQQVVQEHLQDQAHVRLPSVLLDPGPSLVRGLEAAPKAAPDQNLVPVQGVDQDPSLDHVQGADRGQNLDLARVLDLPAFRF